MVDAVEKRISLQRERERERERERARERAGETNKTQAHPGFANQTDQVDMD